VSNRPKFYIQGSVKGADGKYQDLRIGAVWQSRDHPRKMDLNISRSVKKDDSWSDVKATSIQWSDGTETKLGKGHVWLSMWPVDGGSPKPKETDSKPSDFTDDDIPF
jgi:hypothetical protein